MGAKEAIEKANQLHSELMEQKKIHGVWWERYQSISKRMGEANRALFAGEIGVDSWRSVYAECKPFIDDIDQGKSPPHPDPRAWYEARRDALDELGEENGVRSQVD